MEIDIIQSLCPQAEGNSKTTVYGAKCIDIFQTLRRKKMNTVHIKEVGMHPKYVNQYAMSSEAY